MSKDQFEFQPELRFYKQSTNGLENVVAVFDSFSTDDMGRAVRSVKIPVELLSNITFRLDGFDESAVVDNDEQGVRVVKGKIHLTSTDATASNVSYELCSLHFVTSAVEKKKKNQAWEFIPVDAVATAVQNAMSDVLFHALSDFFSGEQLPVATGTEKRFRDVNAAANDAESRRFQAQPAKTPKLNIGNKAIFAIIALPIVVWMLLWAGGRLIKPANPIEDAVAQAMRQDPGSANAQIELTKNTLKQMGLDPGKVGDTGCLAGK